MPDTSRRRDPSSNPSLPSNETGKDQPNPAANEAARPDRAAAPEHAAARSPRSDTEAFDPAPKPEGRAAAAEGRQSAVHNQREAATTVAEPEPRETSAAAPPATDQQDEPEQEEAEKLTPELMADEAARWDAWLAVLLVGFAFALASFQISSDGSATLRHIRSGEYLLAHGLLPPRYDYLTFTAGAGSEDARPWINRSWLFDVLIAALYKLVGLPGLVVVKAVLTAGIAVLLLTVRRSRSPLWWVTICTMLALVAINRQLHVTPEFVTLLFLSATLALLFHVKYRERPSAAWWLVPLMALWVNMDPRFYFGAAAILLFFLGELIERFLRGEDLLDHRLRRLGLACGLALVGTLLNPYLLRAWGSIGELYAVQYPGMRMYGLGGRDYMSWFGGQYWDSFQVGHGSVTPGNLWVGMGWHEIATVFLAAGAAVSFALNWRRLEPSRLLLFLGLALLGMLWVHDLPLTAIASSLALALNGQEWAADFFGRDYRTDWYWVAWTRGVRVVTLLGLALLAIFGFTGHLRGSWGNDSGYGMAPQLAQMLDEMAAGRANDDLPPDELPGSARIFNALPQVGNYLIWLGRQPYIDDRIALFRGRGDDRDLVEAHRDVRVSLRYGQAQPGEIPLEQEVLSLPGWRNEFERFDIHYAIVPLDPATQHWSFFQFTLLQLWSGGWHMTGFGSWGACLLRPDLREPEWQQYAAAHDIDFARLAFRVPRDPPGTIRDARGVAAVPNPSDPQSDLYTIPAAQPTEPIWYYDGLWRRRREVPPAVREAMHMLALAEAMSVEGSQAVPILASQQRYALQLLAIRKAREEVVDNPNSPWAYIVLGRAYQGLLETEVRMRIDIGAIGRVPDTAPWPYPTLLDVRHYGERQQRLQYLYAQFYPAALRGHPMRYYQVITAYNQALRAQPGRPPSPETFYLRGEMGQYTLAQQLQNARRKLAELYEAMGRADLALTHWRAFFASLSPVERLAFEQEGLVERDRLEPLEQRVSEVRGLLRQVDASLPDEAPPEYRAMMRANAALRMGCVEMAAEQVEAIPEGTPLHPDAYLTIATLYLEAGRPELALDALSRVSDADLQTYGSSAGIHLAIREQLRGTVHLVQGNYLEAEHRWRSAIAAYETGVVSGLLEGSRQTLLYGSIARSPDPAAPWSRPMPGSPLATDFLGAVAQAAQAGQIASWETELGLILLEAGQVPGTVHYPGDEWQAWQLPGEPPIRFDQDALDRLHDLLQQRSGDGLVVFRGRILDRWGDPERPQEVEGLADVLLTALVGDAVYAGRLGLHEPLARLLPEDAVGDLTLFDLAARGSNPSLLSQVLSAAGGTDVTVQLRERLLGPIGAESWSWTPAPDVQGQPRSTAAQLAISPSALARFGVLVSSEGFWRTPQGDESRIVADEWFPRLAEAARADPSGEAFGWRANRAPADQVAQRRWPGVPADAVCALSDDRTDVLCVVPSRQLVWVHFGQQAFDDEHLADWTRSTLDALPRIPHDPIVHFQHALAADPETDNRLLLRFLLAQLSAGQEQVESYPPSQMVPVLFAPDPEQEPTVEEEALQSVESQ